MKETEAAKGAKVSKTNVMARAKAKAAARKRVFGPCGHEARWVKVVTFPRTTGRMALQCETCATFTFKEV